MSGPHAAALSGEIHDHRWGFADTNFLFDKKSREVSVTGSRYLLSGYPMPYFVPFVEEVTKTSFSEEKRPEKLSPLPTPVMPAKTAAAFAAAFSGRFSTEEKDRRMHCHGQTTADEVLKVLYGGVLERYPDAVVFCRKKEEVKKLMRLALQHNVCVVPYGGGTNVTCALVIPADEKRPVVMADMRGLDKILHVDAQNMRVVVEAGARGLALEEALNRRGLTLGHEPDSIEFSTVGGWIATNASGMKKNSYGNIEDLVEDFTLVTPAGEIKASDVQPRVSTGMNMQKLLFGNEGNLGIITDATLKVFAQPAVKKYESLIFKNFESGVAFLKDLRGTRTLPSSIRLVDNLQFRFGRALRRKASGFKKIMHALEHLVLKLKKFDENKLAAATIVFEGSQEEVDAQKKIIARLAKKHGGMFGGETNGRRGYMLTYAIAYIRDFLADYYIMGETYETTVPWDKIFDVCSAVDKTAADEHAKHKFPGRSYVSARITQIYQTGVCIYFTHGLSYKGVQNPEKKFAAMEQVIRAAVLSNGGSLSHHHGVGKLRARFVSESPAAKDALFAVKNSLDPKNIMGIRNNVFLRRP